MTLAGVTRGYVDPPKTLVRVNAQPAIALAIGMKSGANLLEFGEALKEQMSKIVADLPIGVGVHLVADQPVGRGRKSGAYSDCARDLFWGPMAYAMMGGIIVGTVLTLLFLPALYVAWFRIKEPDAATHADSKAGFGQPAIAGS